MKVSLSSRQTADYLIKADEIKIKWNDRKIIDDFISKYPNKTLILEKLNTEEINWKEIKDWDILSKHNLILCLGSIAEMREAKRQDIQFYSGFPITTFYEANALIALGVCQIKIGIPLIFEMEKVKQLGIPIRIVPNVAYSDGLPRENGVFGGWVRPEDIVKYEEYNVQFIEFEDCDTRKEQALYRLYKVSHEWPGEIGMIISNFNYPGLNRLIGPEVGQARLNCGQACQSGSYCRICKRAINLADENLIKDYIEHKEG